MNQPSVLLVSFHFHPSREIGARRPTALARFLAEKGLRVIVVSAFGGSPIEPGSEVLPGVVAVPVRKPPRAFTGTVVFLKRRLYRSKSLAAAPQSTGAGPPPSPQATESFWSRIRAIYFRMAYFTDQYKSWGWRAVRAAVRVGRRHAPGLLISSAPPPTVSWAGALAARWLRVPHIVDLRDPWTDTIESLHPDWTLDLALSRKIEGWVMRSASAVTSTGANAARLLVERQPELAPKTFVVRNGYDETVRIADSDTGGRLAILFAGELYLNRDPFPLLHALERLLSRPDVDAARVSVTFMGPMYTGTSVTRWLEGKRCASVVTFVPPQPRDVVADASRNSTVLLNLAQHQPLSVPAKTFEHLASGRENLLLCEDDSESAVLVAKIPGVIQVDPRNAAALDRVLLDLYDRHVNHGRLRAPVEEDIAAFSRTAAHETFWRIMTSVAVSPLEIDMRNRCLESRPSE